MTDTKALRELLDKAGDNPNDKDEWWGPSAKLGAMITMFVKGRALLDALDAAEAEIARMRPVVEAAVRERLAEKAHNMTVRWADESISPQLSAMDQAAQDRADAVDEYERGKP